jgi:hypothetical protein
VFGSHEQPVCIHPHCLYLNKSKRIIYANYHHYCPASLEGYGQPKKKHAMPANLRPHALGSRGHLPRPLSSPHCIRTQALPAWPSTLGSATQRQPTQNRTLTDPVSGCGINPAFEQPRCRGHRLCQRRWPVSASKHQVLNSHSRSPQSLQLRIHLLPSSQLHSKLSVGLIQMISQSGSTGRWPKE